MKCSTCKEDLVEKDEDMLVDIPGCSEHKIKTQFSECPKCNSRYSTPEQMLSFAQEYEKIEARHKHKK